jgi:hypothetical protein
MKLKTSKISLRNMLKSIERCFLQAEKATHWFSEKRVLAYKTVVMADLCVSSLLWKIPNVVYALIGVNLSQVKGCSGHARHPQSGERV